MRDVDLDVPEHHVKKWLAEHFACCHRLLDMMLGLHHQRLRGLQLRHCGVGKSWLVCALGQKACRDDFSVLYKRLPRMFAELETGRADGRYPRLFRALTRANLLILDDSLPGRACSHA